jgi:hypothetical protein
MAWPLLYDTDDFKWCRTEKSNSKVKAVPSSVIRCQFCDWSYKCHIMSYHVIRCHVISLGVMSLSDVIACH